MSKKNDDLDKTKKIEVIKDENTLSKFDDAFMLSDEIEPRQLEKPEKRESFRKKPIKSFVWSALRPIIILVISLAIISSAVYLGYKYIVKNYFEPVDVMNDTPIELVVERGSSLTKIADLLYDNVIIKNKAVFKLYVDMNDMSSKLKAGTYTFSKNMTMDEIMEILGKGDDKVYRVTKFTLPEGMSVSDMIKSLFDKKIIKDTETFKALSKTGEEYSKYPFIRQLLNKDNKDRTYLLEGYLFPDTYEIYVDTEEQEIIEKLLNRFNEIYNEDFIARTEKLGMTIDEVVTLASLIEREGKPQDFKKISSVFHIRLKEEMPLGSDAALAYVLGYKKLSYSESEINTESLYNTHIRAGLPLGPVNNPGKKAIEAALFPDEEYLEEGYKFFCLTDPDSGELIFTKTYEEHLAEVEKYRPLWIAKDQENNN